MKRIFVMIVCLFVFLSTSALAQPSTNPKKSERPKKSKFWGKTSQGQSANEGGGVNKPSGCTSPNVKCKPHGCISEALCAQKRAEATRARKEKKEERGERAAIVFSEAERKKEEDVAYNYKTMKRLEKEFAKLKEDPPGWDPDLTAPVPVWLLIFTIIGLIASFFFMIRFRNQRDSAHKAIQSLMEQDEEAEAKEEGG